MAGPLALITGRWGGVYRLSPLESAEGNGIAENDGSSAQHLAGGKGTGTELSRIPQKDKIGFEL
jgi:hypothetical protein